MNLNFSVTLLLAWKHDVPDLGWRVVERLEPSTHIEAPAALLPDGSSGSPQSPPAWAAPPGAPSDPPSPLFSWWLSKLPSPQWAIPQWHPIVVRNGPTTRPACQALPFWPCLPPQNPFHPVSPPLLPQSPGRCLLPQCGFGSPPGSSHSLWAHLPLALIARKYNIHLLVCLPFPLNGKILEGKIFCV